LASGTGEEARVYKYPRKLPVNEWCRLGGRTNTYNEQNLSQKNNKINERKRIMFKSNIFLGFRWLIHATFHLSALQNCDAKQ
jgi:hypothetical protein